MNQPAHVTPYNAHFLIPASNPELIEKVKSIKNKNEFFNKLAQDYFDGKLNNSKTRRDQLRDEKLEGEVLKLKISNQLSLMREMKKTPEEVALIIKNPELFKVEDIQQTTNNNLSNTQWDFVFGCVIDGWNMQGRIRTCLVCHNDFGHDDNFARKHIMQSEDIKHKTMIQDALRGMVK